MAPSRVRREKNVDNAHTVQDFVQILESYTIKVGWPEAIRYPRPEVEKQIAAERGGPKNKTKTYRHPPNSKPGELVAQVAAKNEFGIGVPARPFMRPTITENKKVWSEIFTKSMRRALNKKITFIGALDLLALKISGDMKKTITRIYSPPLAWSTVQLRLEKYADKTKVGSLTKPLIDTGYMEKTLTSEVSRNDSRK